MPIITVRYATSHEVRPEDVASAASAASTSFLRKRADLTAVIAEPVDQSRWFIAGKSLAEHALASFWLEIRIVEGTQHQRRAGALHNRDFRGDGPTAGTPPSRKLRACP